LAEYWARTDAKSKAHSAPFDLTSQSDAPKPLLTLFWLKQTWAATRAASRVVASASTPLRQHSAKLHPQPRCCQTPSASLASNANRMALNPYYKRSQIALRDHSNLALLCASLPRSPHPSNQKSAREKFSLGRDSVRVEVAPNGAQV